ncbi:hypothetical protein QJS66_21620 [Kocuria rhizophila]|nr:hypothetical protein QJS66_21620 [Kocuria rhizophila]
MTTPSVVQADGKAWLFAPKGMMDGPLPTHYEPQESVEDNPLYAQQQNPRGSCSRGGRPLPRPAGGSRHRCLPVRVHHLPAHGAPRPAGHQPVAAVPVRAAARDVLRDLPELAELEGWNRTGWATIISPRSAMEVKVLVTDRMTPLTVAGRTIHQIRSAVPLGDGLGRGGHG